MPERCLEFLHNCILVWFHVKWFCSHIYRWVWYSSLDVFCRRACECTEISIVSFKRTRCDLFSSCLTRNMWFEICSKADTLLNLKEFNQKKLTSRLAVALLIGTFRGFHNKLTSVLHCSAYSQMKTVIYVTAQSHCVTRNKKTQFTYVAFRVCNGVVIEHTHTESKAVAYELHCPFKLPSAWIWL